MTLDETHDPSLTSWVPGANDHADFPIQNLPLGNFRPAGAAPRPGTRIGDFVLDLRAAAMAGLLPANTSAALQDATLNRILALDPATRKILRRAISALLADPVHRDVVSPMLHTAAACEYLLPAQIGDYTDFYVGINHAYNVGKQFRPDNPLLPNYKHIPIGYHGRASSVRPSGGSVVRPSGQRKAADAEYPVYAPSVRLDFELELGVWIGPGNELGSVIPIDAAPDHFAGLCLLNDWSARDLQAWEYQPLGPFLAKNFHTTVSPWVITPEALAPFRVAQAPRPEGDPVPLPYLHGTTDQRTGAFAIELTVLLSTEAMRNADIAPVTISRSDARNMYWTVAQMITHHASNGCNLQPGDLLGTGTISTPAPGGFGSMLEISNGGANPIVLPTGEERSFLLDGDEVTFEARAVANGYRSIGFGPCTGVIVPAR